MRFVNSILPYVMVAIFIMVMGTLVFEGGDDKAGMAVAPIEKDPGKLDPDDKLEEMVIDQNFALQGSTKDINVNKKYTVNSVYSFGPMEKIYGLSVQGKVDLWKEDSLVQIVLVTDKGERLVAEFYPLIFEDKQEARFDICEETCAIEGEIPYELKINSKGSTVRLDKIRYIESADGVFEKVKKEGVKAYTLEMKKKQDKVKINEINKKIKEKGMNWVAGETSVSMLSYSERKNLYGQSNIPPDFQFYSGGIYSTEPAGAYVDDPTSSETQIASSGETLYVPSLDWRNRHGINWNSPIKNQGACGSCWAFAAVGATEAQANLYFNQKIDLDLSEQDVLSCSGGGSCLGGYPSTALTYISKSGVVDEATFKYSGSDLACSQKGATPVELIKIAGRTDFGSTAYPRTEDDLKRMLLEKGPISGGLYDWSHAMTLVGYKVVEAGDKFYYRDLSLSRYWITVEAGSPLIGKTVWIFKNSWGDRFGDLGYVYVETPITNMGWTHALNVPVQSIVKDRSVACTDRDLDGYYFWGNGVKPASCPISPDVADGDDGDPTIGPIDRYGYPVILDNPPVADFSAAKTQVMVGEKLVFTDHSSSNTEYYEWTFEGATPSSSTLKNPEVTYNSEGVFDVSLTVRNSFGSDTKTISDYITATKLLCKSSGIATSEWIGKVKFGNSYITSGSSGSLGYQDMRTYYTFQAVSGQDVAVALTPVFSSENYDEYFGVWIDLNMDKDFDDQGELLLSLGPVFAESASILKIPSGVEGTTTMRVSMKRGSLPTPCEKFAYGEVEDYTVQISSPVVIAPVADFSAERTVINEGESILFSDRSTNSPTSVSWTFEGGTPQTSTSKNPLVKYATAGTYDVTLKATNSAGSDTKTVESYIVVNSIPSGDIAISSVPNSANIYLNGEVKGITDQTLDGLSPGEYTVMVSKEGYKTASGKFYVIDKQTTQAHFTLETIPKGNLKITSTPTGAKAYVNGVMKGLTPIELNGLDPGSYSIKLTKSGYANYIQTVNVIDGQTTNVDAVFSKKVTKK